MMFNWTELAKKMFREGIVPLLGVLTVLGLLALLFISLVSATSHALVRRSADDVELENKIVTLSKKVVVQSTKPECLR